MGPKRVTKLLVSTVCSSNNSSSSSTHRHVDSAQPLPNRVHATRKRELVLEVEGCPKSKSNPKQNTKRMRSLDLQTPLVERLKENNQKTFSLPLTSKELQSLETDFKKLHFKKERDLLADTTSESGSTSSEVKAEKKGRKQRLLKGRPRGILKKFVDAKLERIGSQSILETFAATPRVREQYSKKMSELRSFLKRHRLPFVTNHDIDSALVKYFNQKFLEGEQSHFGDYTMASLMDHDPSFSKMGDKKVPRAWRCLRGWRRLCPSRSRLALPLPVWCGISWRMIQRGHLQKAIFNLVQLSSYHRPGTLLKLRKIGLVKPTAGITRNWSLVTSLSETMDVSKTGTKDDSILLDSDYIQFLNPYLSQISKGNKTSMVWSFNYAEYLSVFHLCCKDLKIELVPYQARHSGPSIDRAKNVRTQEEVRKRGGWLSRQSVARYEKAGRLAASWQKLPSPVQQACLLAEKYMTEIFQGHGHPDIPLP